MVFGHNCDASLLQAMSGFGGNTGAVTKACIRRRLAASSVSFGLDFGGCGFGESFSRGMASVRPGFSLFSACTVALGAMPRTKTLRNRQQCLCHCLSDAACIFMSPPGLCPSVGGLPQCEANCLGLHVPVIRISRKLRQLTQGRGQGGAGINPLT